MHNWNNKGGWLHAKLRALEGSHESERVDAISMRHGHTFYLLNTTWINDCAECRALSCVVEAGKTVSMSDLIGPVKCDTFTAFSVCGNIPDFIFVIYRIVDLRVLSFVEEVGNVVRMSSSMRTFERDVLTTLPFKEPFPNLCNSIESCSTICTVRKWKMLWLCPARTIVLRIIIAFPSNGHSSHPPVS